MWSNYNIIQNRISNSNLDQYEFSHQFQFKQLQHRKKEKAKKKLTKPKSELFTTAKQQPRWNTYKTTWDKKKLIQVKYSNSQKPGHSYSLLVSFCSFLNGLLCLLRHPFGNRDLGSSIIWIALIQFKKVHLRFNSV